MRGTLHIKRWVWGVWAVVLLALLGALASIGFDTILVDRAAWAAMRTVFLVFMVFGIGVSLVIFTRDSYRVRA